MSSEVKTPRKPIKVSQYFDDIRDNVFLLDGIKPRIMSPSVKLINRLK